MPVFARQLGFSTFVVGTIYSILPILGLVSKPLFGALADRYVYKNFLRFFLVRLRFTCKKKHQPETNLLSELITVHF